MLRWNESHKTLQKLWNEKKHILIRNHRYSDWWSIEFNILYSILMNRLKLRKFCGITSLHNFLFAFLHTLRAKITFLFEKNKICTLACVIYDLLLVSWIFSNFELMSTLGRWNKVCGPRFDTSCLCSNSCYSIRICNHW